MGSVLLQLLFLAVALAAFALLVFLASEVIDLAFVWALGDNSGAGWLAILGLVSLYFVIMLARSAIHGIKNALGDCKKSLGDSPGEWGPPCG